MLEKNKKIYIYIYRSNDKQTGRLLGGGRVGCSDWLPQWEGGRREERKEGGALTVSTAVLISRPRFGTSIATVAPAGRQKVTHAK